MINNNQAVSYTTDAVVVTYYPRITLIVDLLESIIGQVRFIYLVDNTPGRSNNLFVLEGFHNVEILYLNENMGIAHAQNVGIEKALENNPDFILLSDQDTLYPQGYVMNMLVGFQKGNLNEAMIAPLFQNTVSASKRPCFQVKSCFGFTDIYPTSGVYQIYHAIASGSIMRASVFDEVGLMDERLFIDRVDMEWCWRAISKGFILLGNADVLISHRMGDSTINLGFKEVSLRSPIRTYYIIRNDIHLALRCSNITFIHRVVKFIKAIRFLVLIPVLSKPRLLHLKHGLYGLIHGLLGKLGKFDE